MKSAWDDPGRTTNRRSGSFGRALTLKDDEVAQMLERYRPNNVEVEDWVVVRPLLLTAMAYVLSRSKGVLASRLSVLSKFFVWCHRRGYSLELEVVLRR